MPHIVLQLSGAPDQLMARSAVDCVIEHTMAELGKKKEVIAITVQFISADDWYIAGKTLAELGQSAFHLDISVTDETNTKAEKAPFLNAIHADFKRLRPNLHECSYIHVIDARAAAYGYGGKTQEFRHQAAGV